MLWFLFTHESLAREAAWTVVVVAPLAGVFAAIVLGLGLATARCVYHLAGAWVALPVVLGLTISALLVFVFEPGSDPFHNSWFFDFPRSGSGGHGSIIGIVVLVPLIIESVLKFAFVTLGGFTVGAFLSLPALFFGIARRAKRRHSDRTSVSSGSDL